MADWSRSLRGERGEVTPAPSRVARRSTVHEQSPATPASQIVAGQDAVDVKQALRSGPALNPNLGVMSRLGRTGNAGTPGHIPQPPLAPLSSRPSTAGKPTGGPKLGAGSAKVPHPLNLKNLHSQEGSPLESGAVNSPRESVLSVDFTLDDIEAEGESVQVFVRVRPHNQSEVNDSAGVEISCLEPRGTRSVLVNQTGREPHMFTFDQVLWKCNQEEVFEVAGLPVVDNCMAGYNSSIFAYGQTGAGKTHTMVGQITPTEEGANPLRGLAPRAFEYLFHRIGDEEDTKGRDCVRYSCRCSFLEIYNENITDLLNPSATGLMIREDQFRGCFVDGLGEKEVLNVEDVMALMRKGTENRHVGETRMNRESSRSHSVFTCTVEKSSRSENGVTSVICSRLNLIDLAGSERVRSGALGGSQVQGDHFKEAVMINKSLTTLGRVIMELVESQRDRGKGRHRHIPYRDSRLTFLLQDSLGGNAKTMIIANVSPAVQCASETVSTLKFVQRAKCIRNKATINLDYRGDVALLQKEIVRLNTELDNLRKGFTDPAIQEAADLREKLKEEAAKREEGDLKASSLLAEIARYKRQNQRLEERLTDNQNAKYSLADMEERLQEMMQRVQDANEAQLATHSQVAEAERKLLSMEIAELNRELQREHAAADKAAAEHATQAQDLQARLTEADEASATLGVMYSTTKEELGAEKARTEQLTASLDAEKARAEELTGLLGAERASCEQLTGALAAEEQKCGELQSQLTDAHAALEGLKADKGRLEDDLAAERSRAEAALQEVEAQRARAEQAEGKASALDSDKGQLLDDIIQLRDQCEGLQRELAQEKEGRAAAEEALEQARQQGVQLEAARAAEREAGAALQATVEELEAKLAAELSSAAAQLTSEQESLSVERAERAKAQAAADALQAQLDELDAAKAAQGHQLSEVQQQLANAQQQLTELQQQLEERRGELAQRDVELQAQQEAAAGLQQQLEESQKQSSELSASLDEERTAHATTRAALQQQSAAADSTSAAMGELWVQLRSGETRAGELEAELNRERSALERECSARAAEEARAAQLLAQVQDLQGQVQELTGTKTQLQQQVQQLEAQLADVQAASTAEAAALQQQLQQKQEEAAAAAADAEASAAELQQQIDELVAAGEAAQGMIAEQSAALAALKQEAANSSTAHETQSAELAAQISLLNTTVDDLRHEKASLLSVVDEKLAEVMAAKARGNQLEADVADAKQEVAALTEKLQGSKGEVAALKEKLQGTEGALQGVRAELEGVKRALAEEQRAAHDARAKHESQVAALKRNNQEAELQATAQQREAQAHIITLQKELIKSQEEFVAREFELKSRVSALTADLESVKRAAIEAAEMVTVLQNELQDIRDGKGSLEMQLKTHLVTNTRQNKAFQEIRRLIEWATTPPSSTRSSHGFLALRGADGTPMSTAGGDVTAGMASPTVHSAAGVTPACGAGGASPAPMHSISKSPLGMGAAAAGPGSPHVKDALSVASLYRNRSLLTPGAEGAGAAQQHPGVCLSPGSGAAAPSLCASPKLSARSMYLRRSGAASSPRGRLAFESVGTGGAAAGAGGARVSGSLVFANGKAHIVAVDSSMVDDDTAGGADHARAIAEATAHVHAGSKVGEDSPSLSAKKAMIAALTVQVGELGDGDGLDDIANSPLASARDQGAGSVIAA